MSELGEITQCFTLKFSRRSKHPPERVWAALTDPAQASAWMGCPIRIDLRVGGHWHAFKKSGGEPWLPGVIVRVVPHRTLTYVWGYSVLEWLLEPDGGGCRYSFADHGQPYPPSGERGWSAEGVSEGWHQWMDSFAEHLDDGVSRTFDRSDWEQLLGQYRERIARLGEL
jgi:uncharacterized protein YndB with AHSA1/START domain